MLTSAVLALSELLLSGVAMPAAVLRISLGLFAISAVLEGAITLAIVEALESINPDFVRQPQRSAGWVMTGAGLAAIFLAVVGVAFASTHPDGIWKLAGRDGDRRRMPRRCSRRRWRIIRWVCCNLFGCERRAPDWRAWD